MRDITLDLLFILFSVIEARHTQIKLQSLLPWGFDLSVFARMRPTPIFRLQPARTLQMQTTRSLRLQASPQHLFQRSKQMMRPVPVGTKSLVATLKGSC